MSAPGQFHHVPAIAARDIQKPRVGAPRQYPLQKVRLGTGLLRANSTPPHIQRDAAKKLNLPLGLHFFSFKKTH
jgi:hypothetical protein